MDNFSEVLMGRGTDYRNRAHNQALKTENFPQKDFIAASPCNLLRRIPGSSSSRKLPPGGV
jgi:hypothetical protein